MSSGSKYILLNTLWAQERDKGFVFNTYCPIDTRTGWRSVVGCAALMHAQILYYWAEKGYQFGLTLTASDSYKTKTRKIFICELKSSVYDYGLFSEISEQLETVDAADDDIAALCYACGVLIKSDYTSSSTSATMTNREIPSRSGSRKSIPEKSPRKMSEAMRSLSIRTARGLR